MLKEVAYTQSYRPKQREKQGFAKFGELKANLNLEMHGAIKPKQKYFHKKVKTISEPKSDNPHYKHMPGTFSHIQKIKKDLEKQEKIQKMLPDSEKSIGDQGIVVKKSRNTMSPVMGGNFDQVRISLKPNERPHPTQDNDRGAEIASHPSQPTDNAQQNEIEAPKRFYSKVNAKPQQKPENEPSSKQTILSQFMKSAQLDKQKIDSKPHSDLSIFVNNKPVETKPPKRQKRNSSNRKINIFQQSDNQNLNSQLSQPPRQSESNQSQARPGSERKTVIKMNEMNEIEIQKMTKKELIASNLIESNFNKNKEFPKRSKNNSQKEIERNGKSPGNFWEVNAESVHLSRVGESEMSEEYRQDIEKVRKSDYGIALKHRMNTSHNRRRNSPEHSK